MEKQVKRFVHKVIRAVKPTKIVLFGSMARGDVHEGSDADLLVVGDFKQRFFSRVGRILDLNDDASLELNVFPYTPAEFQRMRAQRNPFVERALREGIRVV